MNVLILVTQLDMTVMPGEDSGAYELMEVTEQFRQADVVPDERWWENGKAAISFEDYNVPQAASMKTLWLVTIDCLMASFMPHYRVICKTCLDCRTWILEWVYVLLGSVRRHRNSRKPRESAGIG